MIDLKYGDCLELMKDIPNGSVDMVLTDPPYGTTACKWDSVIPFEPMWEQLKRITKPNGAIVLFGSEPFSSALRMSNIKQYKYDWIYHKSQAQNFLNAKKQPLRNHEVISVFYLKQCIYNPIKTKGSPYIAKSGVGGDSISADDNIKKGGHITVNSGDRYPLSITRKYPQEVGFHPTQKPVALLEYLIKTYTQENDVVLDFTMGSGSTGVACVNTNRKFIGIEMDDEYFEIAEKRIKDAQCSKI